MNKYLKYGLWTVVGLLLSICIYFFYGWFSLGLRWCDNEILQESIYPSPNPLVKAVVFVRNCGATTDWSVQVSILPASRELSGADIGNVFIASQGSASQFNRVGGPLVKVIWKKDNGNLEVQYSQGAEISLETSILGGTAITYTAF